MTQRDDPLFAAEVEAVLDALAPELSEMAALDRLRRRFDAQLARRALELRLLRPKAAWKSPSGRMHWITRKGLEQATHESVAAWRATRFGTRARDRVAYDATCGIGADALALAAAGVTVVAADRDAEVARCARANAERAGLRVFVARAHALSPPLAPVARVALFDPDRRADGERSNDPEEWSPPFARLLGAASEFAGACIKLAPAFHRARHGAGIERCSWSVVSHRGELVETALWLGMLAHEDALEAVAIDAHGDAHRFAGEPGRIDALGDAAARAVRFVVEPDVALLQSDLLGAFATEHRARPLHADIGFLGADGPIESPFARSFRVLAATSADPKLVRAMLREHEIGPLTVKKRGHPAPSEELAKAFRGSGSKHGLLIVVRLESGHCAYLVEVVRLRSTRELPQ